LFLVNKAWERKYSRIIEYSELNFVALVEVAVATRLDPGENQKLCRTPKLLEEGPLGEKVVASFGFTTNFSWKFVAGVIR
jgi:hypothetical protein